MRQLLLSRNHRDVFPWKAVLLVGLAFVFSSCQKSDEYRVVTEEDAAPISEETATQESGSEAQMVQTSPADQESSETLTSVDDTDERVATVTPGDPPAESATSSNAGKETEEPETDETTKAASVTEKDSSTDATAANTEEGASTKDSAVQVSGLINMDEERRRQMRLMRLGFGNEEPAEPRPIKLLVEHREFAIDEKHDALRISYDDLDLLKILNMEPVPLDAEEYLPDWLRALEGKEVVLRGWMYPTGRSSGLKGFIFVRDNQVCCFGPNAKAYDKLTVRLKSGETTDYIQGRPIDVKGVFHIESWIEDERDFRTGELTEKLNMLYHLEDATVVGE